MMMNQIVKLKTAKASSGFTRYCDGCYGFAQNLSSARVSVRVATPNGTMKDFNLPINMIEPVSP